MIKDANPNEPDEPYDYMNSQTVEIRSPDGSANIHQLLAGLTVAALHGLENPNSLKLAEELYVSTEASKCKGLNSLPASCWEAADKLLNDRAFYEKYGIFPPAMIDKLAKDLKAHNDKDMSEKLFGNADALKELVRRFIHCG
jgi:glutamine synthetase